MHVIKNIGHHKYKHYSVEELLQDDYFIYSQTNPTKESDRFWTEALRQKNVCRENYDLACYLIDSLQIRTDLLFPDEIDLLWDDIKKTNKQIKRRKKNPGKKHIFLWMLGDIASIFLLLFIYGKLTNIHTKKHTNDTICHSIEMVKAPQEPVNEIQVILANDEVVAVDGTNADIIHDHEGIAINNQDKRQIKKQTEILETIYHQLIVPNGKRSALTFEDGSKMWVNAGTRIVYPANFSVDKREIYVDGEAYLEVSVDKTRPFIVKSKNFSVNVLGTSFNIMAYENDTNQHLVLISGSVRVHSGNNAETVLSPNEMYISENGNAHVEKVNVEYFTSWKTGMYQYKSERLEAIMKRLSRYYGKDITCMPEVAHLKCSGKLDLKEDLNSVLRGISHTAPINYQFDNDKYLIINK
jgi:hypothetical protein